MLTPKEAGEKVLAHLKAQGVSGKPTYDEFCKAIREVNHEVMVQGEYFTGPHFYFMVCDELGIFPHAPSYKAG